MYKNPSIFYINYIDKKVSTRTHLILKDSLLLDQVALYATKINL